MLGLDNLILLISSSPIIFALIELVFSIFSNEESFTMQFSPLINSISLSAIDNLPSLIDLYSLIGSIKGKDLQYSPSLDIAIPCSIRIMLYTL